MKFGIHEPYESQSRNDADWRNEQYRFKFGNGYGASVIRGQFTYGGSSGLWELAVVGQDGQLDYETPITDDVLGYLSESDVTETLDAIAALAKPAEVSA